MLPFFYFSFIFSFILIIIIILLLLLLLYKTKAKLEKIEKNQFLREEINRKVNVVEAELSDNCANWDWGIGSCIRYV